MLGVYFTVFSTGITSFLFSKFLLVTNNKFDILHRYMDKDYCFNEKIKFRKSLSLIGSISIISSIFSTFIDFFAFKFNNSPVYDNVGILGLTVNMLCFISLFFTWFYFIFIAIIKSTLSKIYKFLIYIICFLIIFILFIKNPFGVLPLNMIELFLTIYF